MKKTIIFTVAITLALMLSSCASTPKAGKPQAAVKGLHAEFTDWQSASVGGNVPEWVQAVLEADSEDGKKPKL